MNPVLSPRELARAIGVSESSLKRWADDGRINVSRTAGGHRRITIADAIRFVRETHSPLLHPEILGLSDLAAAARDDRGEMGDADRLYAYLRQGQAREARGLILSLYLGGLSVAELADGPIRSAMTRLGTLWEQDPAGIYYEHRATDLCIQAVHQLRALLDLEPGAVTTVGGAPPGDPYMLPSLLAATVLESEGFHAINLGPETPLDVLREAALDLDAVLVWLSVTYPPKPEALAREIEQLARALAEHEMRLVIGGQRLGKVHLPPLENTIVGASMAELAAFAKGLRAARQRGSTARGDVSV